MIDDDFRYLSEQGEFGKKEYIENLLSGAIEMRELTTIDSETRYFGDVVIVTGRVRMSASFRGDDISGIDRYTRVWQRSVEGWRALSQHANREGPSS